jgi:phage shock protein C
MVNIKRPLYRSPKYGRIAGVCAGLADYFDFDVTIIRVLFVVGVFITGGAAILLYIILAIILPVDDGETVKAHATVDGEEIGKRIKDLGHEMKANGSASRIRNYVGLSLVVFGVWLLLAQLFPVWVVFRWEFIWPIILILVGISVFAKGVRNGK